MTLPTRVRQLAPAFFLAVLALAIGACGETYPNSTFNHYTDLNTDIDGLWDKLLFWGTLVFIFVEGLLIYTIVRFRKRPDSPPPVMSHGNTKLEIAWTVLPMLILVIIAVPTVRTIFKTQGKAVSSALEIEVIGHQWWWEFRYPQYQFQTANEFYVPKGRTVNFKLNTQDVLHAFWVPQLGGKRDLITNRTNYLWFTPKAELENAVWNGFCTEYCGTSHANMRIRAYTVTPEEFEQWVAGQKAPVQVAATPPAAPAAPGAGGAASAVPTTPQSTPVSATTPLAPQDSARPAPSAGGWMYPTDKLPAHAIPKTPIPAGIEFNDALLASGDAARGEAIVNGKIAPKVSCGSCHQLSQALWMGSMVGPNLTHVATRHTIAGGLYPNDARHLARWIKNAPVMKPGSKMITLGENLIDPTTGKTPIMGKYTDAEIADIVAYLLKLK